MRLLFLMAAVVLSLALGCSGAKTKKHSADHAKSVSGTDEQIFLGDTIEKNYDPNVIMKRAEAFFDKEDYPEAVIEYQHFLDLHRVHMLAPYAQFKLGESHYKMAKTVDRDLEPVHKAEEAFGKLLKEFPGSRYEREAAERIHGCHDLLAQHSFLVGEFYYRRESYLAAAYRFDSILKNYPDMGIASDAMYYLALSYSELGADDWAREQLALFAEKHPTNKYAKDGERLFARLNGKRPLDTAIAKAAPPIAGQGVAALRVAASDRQPAGQASVIPAAAFIPATAAVSASTLANQAFNGAGHISNGTSLVSNGAGQTSDGLAPLSNGSAPHSNGLTSQSGFTIPQMTLCRLGSWC